MQIRFTIVVVHLLVSYFVLAYGVWEALRSFDRNIIFVSIAFGLGSLLFRLFLMVYVSDWYVADKFSIV